MEESNKRFVKKGNKIVLKEVVPDREFDSKDILNNIKQLGTMIEQAKGDVIKKQSEIEHINSEIERLTPLLKEVKKFEAWATEIQESKMKNYIKELMEESIKSVNDSYQYDPVLTVPQENGQKMVMLQNTIGRNKKVAEEIAPDIIKKFIYNECIFSNPWKKD